MDRKIVSWYPAVGGRALGDKTNETLNRCIFDGHCNHVCITDGLVLVNGHDYVAQSCPMRSLRV